VPHPRVAVKRDHPRNHDGEYFTVLAARVKANPKPGSDEIQRAFEEGWVGTNGYVRADGSRQKHALAFQGNVVTTKGETISEVFLVDLPDDLTIAGEGPLAGTESRMPSPPKGAIQRRLTFTAERKFPGLQGPRHWLRSSPDGSQIAFLMKDDAGVAQLWTVSPRGGSPRQVTKNPWPIASTFTWSPDGRFLAHAMDNSVCITVAETGATQRLTPRTDDSTAPRPEACVFSPDGRHLAYVRTVPSPEIPANQIFVATLR
jgi:WD40 repeat protein